MHRFVPANPDLDVRHRMDSSQAQPSMRLNTVDRVAFRAGGGVNLDVTPGMSKVDLVRIMMSASDAYFGYQRLGVNHRYVALGPREDAIRLLALFPGHQAESIKCKIVHTALSERPHYEALSYTWGPTETCAWILLDGVRFPITNNLHGALTDLRFTDRIRYLWVDAICIDQYNDAEKSVQIQQIKTIYSQAHRVLGWLGPSASDSDMAIDLLNGDATAGMEEAETPKPFWEPSTRDCTAGTPEAKNEEPILLAEARMYNAGHESELVENRNRDTAEATNTRPILALDEHQLTGNRHKDEEMTAEELVQVTQEPKDVQDKLKNHGIGVEARLPHGDGKHSKPMQNNEIPDNTGQYDRHAPELESMRIRTYQQRALVALDCLVRRPWWRRVWVSQEFASAGLEPLLFCGQRILTTSQVLAFVNLTDLLVAQWGSALARRVKISVMFRVAHYPTVRQLVQHDCQYCGRTTLSGLLRKSLVLQSTDARDKVYALLGLAEDREELGIVPDYTKSVSEIYTEVTRSVLRTTGRLDLLCFNTNSDNDIPSWASDWSLCARRPHPLWSHQFYNAAGGRLQRMIPTDEFSILEVVGIPVDQVAFVSKVNWPDLEDMSATKDLMSKLMLVVYDAMEKMMPVQIETEEEVTRWWNVLQLDPDPRNSDAFWRTCVANLAADASIVYDHKLEVPDCDSTHAPDEYANMFELLMYASVEGSEMDAANLPGPRRRLSQVLTSVQVQAPRLQDKDFSRIPSEFKPYLAYPERRDAYLRPLISALRKLEGRVLFITTEGYMGIGLAGVEKGDLVAVLKGCEMPVLVREYGGDDCMRFIGEAYVHGLMNGEAFGDVTTDNYKEILRRFKLK
ncbi:MAG: hypothetical protein Q9218_006183 [Villophora microphyllina]